MRILHTSDWHLGRSLLSKRRYEEFNQFLEWMLDCLQQQAIDVLIIAGDIFDTTTPSVTAQDQYYNFLARAASQTNCQHIVVIGGNHDSASFLNAPSAVLKHLNVHVIGQACDPIEDEVLLLRDRNGKVGLVVAAVPFLSDRDIRRYTPLESLEDRDARIIAAYHHHYQAVSDYAEQLATQHQVPLVATGHLFMTGGITTEGDGVRDLYVGSLGQLRADMFSSAINYVALGHIHQHQRVAGLNHIRYSGAPLAMCFDEVERSKYVLVVDFDEAHQAIVSEIEVPQFQRLARVVGDLSHLRQALKNLTSEGIAIWVEVTYEGKAVQANLREQLEAIIEGSQVEILKLVNRQRQAPHLQSQEELESLEELSVVDVFQRLLDQQQIPTEQQAELLQTYHETLHRLELDAEN